MKLSSVGRHLPTCAAVAAASNGKKPGTPCTTFPFFPQTVAATAPVDAQTLASPGETLPLHFTARLGEELLAGRERGGAMAAAYLFPKSDGRDWLAAPIAGLPGAQPFRPRTTHCELTERSRERAPWPEPAFPGCPLPLLPFFPARHAMEAWCPRARRAARCGGLPPAHTRGRHCCAQRHSSTSALPENPQSQRRPGKRRGRDLG